MHDDAGMLPDKSAADRRGMRADELRLRRRINDIRLYIEEMRELLKDAPAEKSAERRQVERRLDLIEERMALTEKRIEEFREERTADR